jgi:TetR/AcrR family transcriptional repressor of nem operon
MTVVMNRFMMAAINHVKGDQQTEESPMRVSKQRAAQNRKRMLTAAARLFRENGIGATGVDAISRDAGLTHGAFYSQFGSKDALAAEAIRFALARSKRVWQQRAGRKQGGGAFRSIVAGYLSREHRDSPGQGCAVAALGTDIARQPRTVREAFTQELKDALDLLAGLVPGDDPSRRRENAIAAFACMAGGLILARAVSDEALSKTILETTAERVIRRAPIRRRARSPIRRRPAATGSRAATRALAASPASPDNR